MTVSKTCGAFVKLFFSFCCIGTLLGCNDCQFAYSPIGEWELRISRNNKIEEAAIPVTTMTLYADGKFICSALEGDKYETNGGDWKQRGNTIILNDRTGEHCVLMEGENKLLFRIILSKSLAFKYFMSGNHAMPYSDHRAYMENAVNLLRLTRIAIISLWRSVQKGGGEHWQKWRFLKLMGRP